MVKTRAPTAFFFVGEALALDLVNTEVISRGRPRDLLAAPNDLAAWWVAARARHPEPEVARTDDVATIWDTTLLARAKEVRAALRRLFSAVAMGTTVEEADLTVLNASLRPGYHVLRRDAAGGIRTGYGVRAAGSGALLLPVALSALRLLTEADPARLHRCRNERCTLLFYDTTRSATRRWCSPGCMNRARSAERYRQRCQEVSDVAGLG